jgi:4,5-DOPA dioxygenase extradiol
LLYIAGVAAEAGEPMDAFLRGYALGSLSMTCYGIGGQFGCREEQGAAELPQRIPADQTNI